MARRRQHRPFSSPRAAATQSGRIRLIGGLYKRRLLPVIDSPGLRPTPDRVRETLFNWLGTELIGANVLDLFSGTGALGFEALSRGARHLQLIEQQPRVADGLRQNMAALNADAQTSLYQGDALHWLLDTDIIPYDLVFLDPPFRQGLAAPCCEALEARGWLADNAFIYLEVEQTLCVTPPSTWRLYRETLAGDSHGMLWQRITAGG